MCESFLKLKLREVHRLVRKEEGKIIPASFQAFLPLSFHVAGQSRTLHEPDHQPGGGWSLVCFRFDLLGWVVILYEDAFVCLLFLPIFIRHQMGSIAGQSGTSITWMGVCIPRVMETPAKINLFPQDPQTHFEIHYATIFI